MISDCGYVEVMVRAVILCGAVCGVCGFGNRSGRGVRYHETAGGVCDGVEYTRV